MDALFLSCCVKGISLSRHFTPAVGDAVAMMLAFALLVAGLLLLARPVLLSRVSR